VDGAQRLVQVPPGVQCFVGDEARRRRRIEEVVVSVFEGWDYEEIIPPLYDYAEVFASSSLRPKTFSFLGRDGSLLALRPDFTSLLAKIAAGRLRERPLPLRLYYSGEVLRYEPPRAGRQSELYQMGLERLGGGDRAGDVEVLAIAAECLERLGSTGFVLALGHVGVFSGLTNGLMDETTLDALRDRVEARDANGVRETIAAARVSPQVAAALERLPRMAGGASVLDQAREAFAAFPAALASVEELSRVVAALTAAGLGDQLAVDLGEVRGLDYYTGLVFRIYAPGLGFEVGAGGRYDALVGRFGRPMPAIGFSLGLDRLDLLLARQGVSPDGAAPNVSTIPAGDPGLALAEARRQRAGGTRVRFGNGEPR
jgi:ATP phosphoribosyltransferase regulatory subunit